MPTTVHKRTYTVLAIIAISVIIENIWLFWDGDTKKINPFPYLTNYPISVQWYAANVCRGIAYVVLAFAFMPYSRMNQVAKVGHIVYIIYKVEDLCSYMLWAGTNSYTIVLSFLLLAALVVCYLEFRPKTHYKRSESVRASRHGNRKLLTNQ